MKIARPIAALGLLLAVAAAGTLAFIYSGLYDIAATTPHFRLTWWVTRTTMEQSVKRHARDIKVPELDDPEKVHKGFKNFHEMCVICHGAPGTPASQLSKGLYPEAPDLAEAVKDWTPAELYVITKRGIKMTGMPAWEPTHSGEELWEIVAFLKLLPTMPADEYQSAVKYYEMNAADKSTGKQADQH
jgi:mono/diheme cytochrome c family protein